MKKLMKTFLTAVIIVLAAVCLLAVPGLAAEQEDQKWVGAWGTGPTELGVDGYSAITAYVGKVTVRTVITPTASGSELRVKFSNIYGEEPLVLTRATVSRSISGSKINTASTKIITFNEGYQGVTIAPGEEIYCDPVVYDVVAGENLAISIYAAEFTEVKTMGLSGADTYLTFGDDATSKESFGLLPTFIDNKEIVDVMSALLGSDIDLNLGYSFIKVVPIITNLDVLAQGSNAYSVVVIGDSTVSNEFPLYLSQQITDAGINNVGVVGKGIIGNRLLGDGLGFGSQIYGVSLTERFDIDALATSGVKYVILKVGANDIMHPVCSDVMAAYPGIQQPTAQEIIAGYQNLFDKCHQAGIKIVVIGITQWKGNTRNYFGSGDKYVRTDEEFLADWQIALDVNKWLAETDEHDGYVDFVSLSANPKDPNAFYPEYTIDGAHPSDTLQKLWAEKFPLSLIGIGKSVNSVKLDITAMGVYAGYSRQLTATVSPEGADNKELIWSSSNPDAATVDQNGKVTGVADGITYITCKTVDGLYKATCYVRVITMVKSVSLNRTVAGAYTTRSFTLVATVSPANATNKKVIWSTSNPKVAVVDQNGKVTGVGVGTAYITAKTENRGETATCRVRVVKKTEVTALQLNRTYAALYEGVSYNMKATISPSDATYPQVLWDSSDPNVITVDKNGRITAKNAGTCYVTATSYDNPMIKQTCKVNVYVKATGLKLSNTAVGCYTGFTRTVTATMIPADAHYKTVTWKSDNPKIATVNSKGVITGIRAGTTYITCTSVKDGFTQRCKVNVVNPVKSTKIAFAQSTVTIDDGTLGALTVKFAPSNTSVKKVTYTSSNPNIAKVYSNGKIYGVTPGTVTITATAADSGVRATCKVKVNPVYPTGVSLDAKKKTVDYGEIDKITATVAPSNCSYRSVTWKSSDPTVVYVSKYGYIKGMKAGASATITCTTNTGKKVASCVVTVNPIRVTGVKLNKSTVNLSVSTNYRLTATIAPSNATNKNLVWSSSDTSVAKISKKGLIVPVDNGTAVITVKTADGGFSAYCVVQVRNIKVTGVTLNKSSLIANRGATCTLIATVKPSNATNAAVTWKSTNTAVATVRNGVVTAVGKGYCEIRVYTADGNYVARCKIQVI